ncbi:MAG: HAD family acid phosphatase [Myxococcota bacterium]
MNRALLLLFLLGACADEGVEDRCEAPAPEGRWQRPLRSELIVALGEPTHAVRDAFVPRGQRVRLEGKFAYGPASTDLEGEEVAAFVAVGGCEFLDLGVAATDSDGRARFDLRVELPVRSAPYAVEMIVLADGSRASGGLYVVPPGPVVVFDIDGTLTTSDLEMVDGIVIHHVGATSEALFELSGSALSRAQWRGVLDVVFDEDATVREGAVDLAWAYADAGVQPVYITGRPYLYDAMTRRWLSDRAFPPGPLFMAQSMAESIPNVGAYKRELLLELQSDGHEIRAAYGNASTDVCAYEEAGIDASRTFIIGPNAGSACRGDATQPLSSFPSHEPLL